MQTDDLPGLVQPAEPVEVDGQRLGDLIERLKEQGKYIATLRVIGNALYSATVLPLPPNGEMAYKTKTIGNSESRTET